MPRACVFGSERTIDSSGSFGDAIRFAQRTLAEINARGAPKFQKFYDSFMKFLRKFCVVSTPDAYLFGADRTLDFINSCNDVTRLAKRTLAESTQFFCAKRAEIPEIFQNFRRILEQNLRQ